MPALPQNNGLVEIQGGKQQKERGFCCMKLIKFLVRDNVKDWDEWHGARRFTAYNLMTRGAIEDARYRPKANEVIRRLLHEMVDQGYLDECVRVYAASEHFDTQIRNQIELTVIQPEDNYDTGIFLQIYGNNE